MNGAAVVAQEVTLRIERLAQANGMREASDELSFKLLRRKLQKSCGAEHIALREVDETAYVAAIRAARLALEAEALHCF
jgi:hypothetical protein